MNKTPEKMAPKTFTINDIRSWQPCYDPARHLPENWSGTVADILRHDTIPPKDKIWVVCREELIDAKTLRLFAVWCARQVQHLMTDARSITALDVAERFANGDATQAALAAARVVAWAAAWDATGDATGDAAKDAAKAAARAAARAAAWAATGDAAGDAAWDAAKDATGDAQVAQLLRMVEDK